ncbi:hypothetical protein D9M71_693900 [compost metagenome]
MGYHRSQANGPVLVITNPLHQRKTQAQALPTPLITANKRPEHRFTLLLGNTHATVLDRKTRRLEGQADKAIVRVMRGIAQQITHYRLQEGGVVQRR